MSLANTALKSLFAGCPLDSQLMTEILPAQAVTDASGPMPSLGQCFVYNGRAGQPVIYGCLQLPQCLFQARSRLRDARRDPRHCCSLDCLE